MKILWRILAGIAVLIVLLAGFVIWASSSAVQDVAWIEEYDESGVAESGPSSSPSEGFGVDGDSAAATRGSIRSLDTLVVMTYNVGYLSGMTNNLPVDRDAAVFEQNMQRVAEAIRQSRPDIIGFQEIDVRSSRSFDINQVESLAVRGGYPQAAIAVNWNERYVPFPSAWPRHHFGRMVSAQAVLSRFPITEHRRIVLAPPDGAPIYGEGSLLSQLANRFYIERLAQIGFVDAGRPIAVINVHLEAFDTETRERQAEQLVEIYRELEADFAVLMIGDFNAVMPSAKHPDRLGAERLEAFQDDLSLERLLEETGLEGVFPDSIYASRDEATFTFSSAEPQVQIDHIFFEPADFDLIDADVLDVAGHPSDHRPVIGRLVLRD